ncbi:hypothetical protein [Streptomyces nodosus]|uniref:Lipoprotein n=1 Tax=Streptomyces nodosus TaxID=40318 RepID=A0A0B5DA78_9ACTN|nr:hypothetical protein [Streptomyces nodosus]AJE40493.1 hypothetical protein SNOD_10890 [Streptomyces nodosus]MBB4791539.1 hypothetical protein [Streptomyces nodosus]QEV39055.1 hypothetical protein CP978_11215 [Streptomyces nodosus]
MNLPRNDGRRTAWCRSQYSPWMLTTGVVLAVALLAFAAISAEYRTVSLELLAAPAAFLVTGGVKVTVFPHGVTVSSALVPLLRRTFTTDRIAHASARWTRPMDVGGWGYRWKPGLRAVSLREGDALWLELTRGISFVVTIDDAGTAADLINQHLPSSSERRPVGHHPEIPPTNG